MVSTLSGFSGCAKEGTGLKQCGSCMKDWYCDQICLMKSWPTHKVYCHEITRKTSELSNQMKKYYDFIEFTPGTTFVYYWGNISAVDLINFLLNGRLRVFQTVLSPCLWRWRSTKYRSVSLSTSGSLSRRAHLCFERYLRLHSRQDGSYPVSAIQRSVSFV